MKALSALALLAVALTLVSCTLACTPVNRRNTKWLGLPGPDGSSTYVAVTFIHAAITSFRRFGTFFLPF